MEKEIWRPIKGYEGLYEASNLGNVRSLDRVVNYSNGRKHLRKGRILKPAKGANGYLACSLYRNSKCKLFNVHRLVAETFIPNPNKLPEVNHKDENKTNNCDENLEWCTRKYNNCYGTRLKRVVETQSKTVLQVDKNTNEIIAEYPSMAEAARQLNISQWHISDCCNGKQKTYKGFKWKCKKE